MGKIAKSNDDLREDELFEATLNKLGKHRIKAGKVIWEPNVKAKHDPRSAVIANSVEALNKFISSGQLIIDSKGKISEGGLK